MSVRTPCIPHTGYISPQGYGRQSHKNKSVMSHRLAYALHHGIELDSITGMVVRHTCDNPACVNPEHLILGTQKENMADKFERGRANTPKGHALPQTTPAHKEMEVRRLLALGVTHSEIRRLTGVSTTTVSRIRNGAVR